MVCTLLVPLAFDIVIKEVYRSSTWLPFSLQEILNVHNKLQVRQLFALTLAGMEPL
jgi:hypothetical protein